MSIKVLKFTIDPNNPAIKMSINAKILSGGFTSGDNCNIWAECDTSLHETEIRNIHAFPTGVDIPYNMGIDFEFLFTVISEDKLVFHIYERKGL